MYTVGNKKAYDSYLASDPFAVKLGCTDSYRGGVAFHDASRAESWIARQGYNEQYSVYGLDCDADNCWFDREIEELRILDTTKLVMLEGAT